LEELGSSIEQARQAVEAAEATEVAEVAEAAAQLGAFEQFEQERRDADRLDEVQRPREWERARQPVIELPNCVASWKSIRARCFQLLLSIVVRYLEDPKAWK
jgi:hypothetical protein